MDLYSRLRNRKVPHGYSKWNQAARDLIRASDTRTQGLVVREGNQAGLKHVFSNGWVDRY
jgi:hypothetical protein